MMRDNTVFNFIGDGNNAIKELHTTDAEGKTNILCSNVATGRVLALNENGIIVGTKVGDTISEEGTFITKDGINASAIKAGTITGVKIIGGNQNGVHAVMQPQATFSIKRGTTGKVAELSFHVSRASGGDTGRLLVNCDSKITLNSAMSGIYMFSKRNYLSDQANFLVNETYAEFDVELYAMKGLQVSGSKNALVPTQHYGNRLLYCDESDRNYFTTKGIGKTQGLECKIELDPAFMETIELNSSCPYIIQLTPYSDAKVWVSEVQDSYFVVKSDKEVKFSYVLNAIRISYKYVYLEESTNRLITKQLRSIQEDVVKRMSVE